MTMPTGQALRGFVNPMARRTAVVEPLAADPYDFHRGLAGYAPTALRELPELAARLGIARLWAKDETSRFGLPAFKVLGASWAIERALSGRPDVRMLVAATDGNHGRAVAHVARARGLASHIVVPDDMVIARREAIAGEGATVEVIEGSYDDAVARSATYESAHVAVISDTAWPGYEAVPRAVIDGYATMLREVEKQLEELGEPPPDLVVVPVGVGALATAVIRGARGPGGWGARVMTVEPLDAACAMSSAEAGAPTEVPPPHRSVMAGLNCGNISPLAWPALRTGVDVFTAIDDVLALEGVASLATAGVLAGECSGGTLGGLMALAADPGPFADALGMGPSSSALVLLTEGRTGEAA